MSSNVIKLTQSDHGADNVPTRNAASAIHTRTSAWMRKCLIGVAVRSRAIEADIIMVKMTPTMEFSGPKMNWNTFTYRIIKRKFNVPKRKL